MNKTQIEWALNPDGTPGYTWNPITGCLNHIGGMCKGGGFPCYAHGLATTRLRETYLANYDVAGDRAPFKEEVIAKYKDPFYPRFWPERFNIRRKYDYGDCRNHIAPRGIFCCDMSDLFGIGIPEEWTRKVIHEIRENPVDRFYLLTKQPQNLIKFSPFPDNCWVGVTATNRRYFNMAIGNLASVKAKVRFVSFEPLLERVNHDTLPYLQAVLKEGHINWLIIGAQTKPYKPPKIEWLVEIVKAAGKASIPVFLKDNLRMAGDISMQVGYLKQEMPDG